MIDVQKIWLTDTAIWIQTADGRKASEKFADYASLRNASKQEREDYSCSPFGVHWPRLDEDLSYEGLSFIAGTDSKKKQLQAQGVALHRKSTTAKNLGF